MEFGHGHFLGGEFLQQSLPCLAGIVDGKLFREGAVFHHQIFVHSAHNEELYAPLCFDFGAYGYMNKGQDVQTIVHAIRMVLDGGVYLSPRMLQWFTGCALTRETVEMGHPLIKLSPRELQVFEMLGRGLDIKEIAGQLSLDHKTVELYRQRIKTKLKVDSASAVLRAAVLWDNSSASSS